MTKLEKLYNIIENSRKVGVKLTVLQQVEEMEEGIITKNNYHCTMVLDVLSPLTST